MNDDPAPAAATLRRGARLDALAAAGLGGAFLVSGHLLLRALAVAEGATGDDACRAVFGAGCDATLSHPFSTQGGIPLAGWGVVGTASVLLLLGLGRALDGPFRPRAAAAASVLLLVGGLASAALVATLLAGVFPLCPLCLAANALNLAAVGAWTGALVRRGELGAHARSVRAGLRYVLGGKPADPVAARWCVVGFALVAVTGFAIYQWILVEAGRREAARDHPLDPARLVADYEAAPVAEIALDVDDPSLGMPFARAELVVFSDAFCPFCRSLWLRILADLGRYRQDLRVVHKHFPLDASCNSGSPATVHPAACAAAHALDAARRQDAFWAYLERLGAPGLRGHPDPFGFAAQDLGLDVERFRSDLGGDAVRARVQADVETGNRLGLTSTPAVFLNGRRVQDLRPEALGVLLDHVLERGPPPRN